MYPCTWYQFLITFSTPHPTPSTYPSTHNFPPASPPFYVFLLCRWRRGRARSCGEAARQGVENPKRWEDIGTLQKAMKSIHFTLHATQNPLARPMLYNGAAVFEPCPKRIIPTNIWNSFKKKLKGNWSLQANFRRNRKKTISLGI